MQYIDLGIIPIYIFDGKPPVEKQLTLQERNKKAEECKQLAEKSETKDNDIDVETQKLINEKENFTEEYYGFSIPEAIIRSCLRNRLVKANLITLKSGVYSVTKDFISNTNFVEDFKNSRDESRRSISKATWRGKTKSEKKQS